MNTPLFSTTCATCHRALGTMDTCLTCLQAKKMYEPKRTDANAGRAEQAFHGRTCGECAWCCESRKFKTPEPRQFMFCRRTCFGQAMGDDAIWMGEVEDITHACPAFVAKGDE